MQYVKWILLGTLGVGGLATFLALKPSQKAQLVKSVEATSPSTFRLVCAEFKGTKSSRLPLNRCSEAFEMVGMDSLLKHCPTTTDNVNYSCPDDYVKDLWIKP